MSNVMKNTGVGQQSALSPAKQALLAKWLRERPRAADGAPNGSIPRRTSSGPVPLSFEQQRLWFFHQLEPRSPLYTMPIGARLRGVLLPEALQQAFDAVVARHETLRTRFVGESPEVVVDPPRTTRLTLIDLRDCDPAKRESEAKRLLEEEAKRPFDLSSDLMMRATLVRMEEEEWILLVLMHHIASDDWSWRVFCREVAAVYEENIKHRAPEAHADTDTQAGRAVPCAPHESPGKMDSSREIGGGQGTARPTCSSPDTRHSSGLPELRIQYGDFVDWQKGWLRDGVLEELLGYWRKQLAGAPEVLELPTDRPRPARQTFRGACEWLKLPAPVNEKIHALSRQMGVTPFMILLATFQALVHRYTGQDDLVVGSPVAGRTRGGVDGLIGLFINMLVLRTDVGGDPAFSELLRRVQRTALEALGQQEMPFEKLVQELQPERSASHSPLIQTMFALQDELSESLKLPGLAVSPYQVETGTAKFDLTLTIVQSAGSLDCCAEYNTDIFEASTIRRVLGHYEQLLEAVLVNPEKRLSELPLLTEEERQQMLVEWNRTEAEYPRDKCVHELFAAQSAATPEVVAVVCGGEQLTYGELNRRANQLAHYLRRLGVGAESLVAVGMDRSLDMVVALLGILKAGGAYLPIDPSYPAERRDFMLKDSGAALLLARKGEPRTADVVSYNGVRTVWVDEDAEIAKESREEIEAKVDSGNLAYVIYTSGSTGKPKGVQIEHRSVVNFLETMRREPGLSKEDTLVSVTSISFDIAGLEIFLPLTTGARLVLADKDTLSDGGRLARLMEERRATVMQATPTLWRFLVDSGWRGDRRLKILCGGEGLSRELAEQLLERGGGVWNMYGPTETTIWSTVCRLERDKEPISIGRPIGNTQIYLLDRYLQPVPIGVPGLLYIGGDGLARGYLKRPELTAEKFIGNPSSIESSSTKHQVLKETVETVDRIAAESDTPLKEGVNETRYGRLYNTGDVARYREDGRIEWLGRADAEVKLRGHRIDLGEIESTLRRYPGVREAVVAMREDEPGQKRLVGYLIMQAKGVNESAVGFGAGELQAFLKRQLPDYMVPEAFVPLDEFPTTPNGKVNRKGLPAPTPVAERNGTGKIVAPRTAVEEKLAEIWRGVMKRDEIGVEDDFFDLGGHSLLAMMVISRVRKIFHAELTLSDIFEAPTIAGLARILGEEPGIGAINGNGNGARDGKSLAEAGSGDREGMSLVTSAAAKNSAAGPKLGSPGRRSQEMESFERLKE